jgi:CRISPR-associated protein Cmr2
LSSALAAFAHTAEAIVKKHFGALLYSGGDDVMAFLPLDTALPCSDELRRAFAGAVSDSSGEMTATLSVGVCIAHYHAHLDSVLRWARHAEKVAKQSRNSIAVELHTRSAGDDCIVVSDCWDANPIDTWKSCIDDLLADRLPAGLPYKLRKLADEFGALAENNRTDLRDALKAEVLRVTSRSRSSGGAAAITQQTQSRVITSAESPTDLRRAVNRMLIARHIARSVALVNIGAMAGGNVNV